MAVITNSEIKFVKSLSLKKNREQSALFTVEGEKMVSEALNSGFEVEKIYRRDEIGDAAMARISSLSTPSPVLAVVKQRPASAGVPEVKGICLALDGVRDPGNMGTILRIADWFALSCVFLSPDCVELYNPKVVQATMGAIFRVNTAVCDLPELCRSHSAEGGRVYGTLLDGDNIYGTPLTPEALIVMGNESEGISAAVRECLTDRILIPSFASGAGAESLNVAVATAVTVAEFRRRNAF